MRWLSKTRKNLGLHRPYLFVRRHPCPPSEPFRVMMSLLAYALKRNARDQRTISNAGIHFGKVHAYWSTHRDCMRLERVLKPFSNLYRIDTLLTFEPGICAGASALRKSAAHRRHSTHCNPVLTISDKNPCSDVWNKCRNDDDDDVFVEAAIKKHFMEPDRILKGYIYMRDTEDVVLKYKSIAL
jgi:hypothetical protein